MALAGVKGDRWAPIHSQLYMRPRRIFICPVPGVSGRLLGLAGPVDWELVRGPEPLKAPIGPRSPPTSVAAVDRSEYLCLSAGQVIWGWGQLLGWTASRALCLQPWSPGSVESHAVPLWGQRGPGSACQWEAAGALRLLVLSLEEEMETGGRGT